LKDEAFELLLLDVLFASTKSSDATC